MQVSEELPWEHIQEQDMQSAVDKSFLGDIMQVPPMYSAIKVRLDCSIYQKLYLPVCSPLEVYVICSLLNDRCTVAYLHHKWQF